MGGIKYKMNVGWASAVRSAERLKNETQLLLMLRYRQPILQIILPPYLRVFTQREKRCLTKVSTYQTAMF
ncbi:hypothetical protein MICAE_1780017 [Microcystis aeruginosa PCC 9806]|uniref:Uncharacterized protein n=1 Tax=Microcystis aeruginosa PCC 9806 TaxID=1160282 RepID=I4GTZ6_MICAE|nr:hypothetical protein MICAE_1780017 [Microcystis aeruginosa PCC 9806]